MPKARSILLAALLLILLAACAILLWPLGGGRVSAVETPDLRYAPEPYVAVRSTYVAPDPPDVSIGGFDRPEGVPDYEILEIHRSERDIKARYANLDSVSVEFIDSEDFLDYRGGALIFNTAAGAYFQDFAYGPPNNQGYLVRAAE